jgi:hypothetical protein
VVPRLSTVLSQVIVPMVQSTLWVSSSASAELAVAMNG